MSGYLKFNDGNPINISTETHKKANYYAPKISKPTLIVHDVTLKNIENQLLTTRVNLNKFQNDLIRINKVEKSKLEWIIALQQLLRKNDEVVDILGQTAIINLSFDSIKMICEKYLKNFTGNETLSTYALAAQFTIFFDKIAQLSIPIDTLRLVAFNYLQLLIPNANVFGAAKFKKKNIQATLSVIVRKYLKNEIETAEKSLTNTINDLKGNIDKFRIYVKPLQTHVDEIIMNLIALNNENHIEKRRKIRNCLENAINTFNDRQWLKQVKNHVQMICHDVENVITLQETLPVLIDDHLPYESKQIKKSLMINWMRLQRIQIRMNTIADGVQDFVRVFKRHNSLVPTWMIHLECLTFERTKIIEIFRQNSIPFTKKTTDRLRFLLNSFAFLRNNIKTDIIINAEHYLRRITDMNIDLNIDRNIECYWDIYSTEFLLPNRCRFKADQNDYMMETRIKNAVEAVKQTNKSLLDLIAKIEVNVINERSRAEIIVEKMNELEPILKSKEVTKYKSKINKLIFEIKIILIEGSSRSQVFQTSEIQRTMDQIKNLIENGYMYNNSSISMLEKLVV